MQVAKQPYELLVRWDADGKLSGAHVMWRYVVSDGDTRVSENISEALPVAIGASKGFPLNEILDQVHTDALTAQQASEAALVEARAEIEALSTKVPAEPVAEDA